MRAFLASPLPMLTLPAFLCVFVHRIGVDDDPSIDEHGENKGVRVDTLTRDRHTDLATCLGARTGMNRIEMNRDISQLPDPLPALVPPSPWCGVPESLQQRPRVHSSLLHPTRETVFCYLRAPARCLLGILFVFVFVGSVSALTELTSFADAWVLRRRVTLAREADVEERGN
ncbi:hypothetical protein EYR38_008405 [Pleurotus pulmonarius]|nr:hypothetical protein EYR38_008403 [Pleurotus pulmonarius]KAF4592706.1 hypothetical protein EYR38_008405 [Pleurotus pulmonarius]